MQLSVRQRSNIRHFIYYLVNGTLDFELLNNTPGTGYHEYLKQNPEVFFTVCCVFINQECKNAPAWPEVKRLGRFVYQQIEPYDVANKILFEDWELDFSFGKPDFASAFKAFAYWFSVTQSNNPTITPFRYSDIISDGASFSEQCFAIWANVIVTENNIVQNQQHAIERVIEYIKSYYVPGYKSNLADWEFELY